MAFPTPILPAWTNTGRSTLASGIDQTQTSLTLAAGTGSRFPAANWRATIWNETDFPDNPDDDGDREFIEVTSRTGDTCTIVRGAPAFAHNAPGKTYAIALVVDVSFRDLLELRAQLARRVVLTTPGTYPVPVPAGATHVLIRRLVGAGAGGGGGGSGAENVSNMVGAGGGSGGGAGETIEDALLAVTPGEDLSVVVGAGGPGGPGGAGRAGGGTTGNGTTGTAGTAGGNSSVTGLAGSVTALGGPAGNPGIAGGDNGVSGTNPDGDGGAAPAQHETSLAFPAAAGGSTATLNGAAGGKGAVSAYYRGRFTPATGGPGTAGGAISTGNGTAGGDALGVGNGGGGGGGSGSSTNNAGTGNGGDGGDGAPGLAVLEWLG